MFEVFLSFSGIDIPFTWKERRLNIKQNFELFLHDVKVWDRLNKNWSSHYIMKGYKFFWNTEYFIIMSRLQHGFLSCLYRLSLPAGLSILYWQRAAVLAGRPTFARPCEGVHKSRSLMSSSLLLQQCPACLVRLIWIVFVMGGSMWPYICYFVGCCLHDLYNIAHIILV